MARTVGIPPTLERLKHYVQARLTDRTRATQFNRLNLSGPVVRDVLGSCMRLDPARKGLDRDILLDGIREPVATGHIMRLLKPDDVVLEVGANIGYYALIEARLCQKVYAAEPHPDNFQRLIENIALNEIGNVETFNIAFGSIDGEATLNCSDQSNWHSFRNVTGNANAISVQMLRIDSFIADKIKPTFIKMDVEGFELEVLRGATAALKDVRCVFVELHGDILTLTEMRQAIDLLRAAGLTASLVVQYDRPGLSRIWPANHIDQIYAGDRGTYELFFNRG